MHVMPNKCRRAKNLFDIVKHIIIGLVDIGFQELSRIRDNIAIDRKAISSFCSPPKFSFVYPHLVMKSRPLFFQFHSDYILKFIRKN